MKKQPITVGEVARLLDALAPPQLALPDDNVGLLVGDPAAGVERAVVCTRMTEAVLTRAVKKSASLIVSYEPVIPEPLDAITTDEPASRLIASLIQNNVAAIACHTNLQAAPSGLDELVAAALRIVDSRPLLTIESLRRYKLVVFVPPKSREKVRQAICEAGGGIIGDYTDCTFRLTGTGTYFGTETTDPAVGEKEQLESVEEERLETVVAEAALDEVLEAMLDAHPYEEVAYDLYELQTAKPTEGFGRVGPVEQAPPFKKYLEAIKRFFQLSQVIATGRAPRKVRTAAFATGSADLVAGAVAATRPDLFITGEISAEPLTQLRDAGVFTLQVGRHPAQRQFVYYLLGAMDTLLPELDWLGDYADPLPSKNL